MTSTEASRALPDWRFLVGRMHLSVDAGDFNSALDLLNTIAALAIKQDHHPDLDLRFSRLHVVTSSHDVGGITERDVKLGTAISELLRDRGLSPDDDEESVCSWREARESGV